MNLLIISNADSCRSRIAQALLSSFGKGMKVYSAGTMPAAEIHPLVLKLIKETEKNTKYFLINDILSHILTQEKEVLVIFI